MKIIQLTRGKTAVIDDGDYEKVSRHKWAFLSSGTGYATARINKKSILLHRFILNAPSGLDVDHIDHDGLNNVRENLRVCKRSENIANSRLYINNTSGRKGVCFNKKTDKWYAYIGFDNKDINLGEYEDFFDAVSARENAEILYFGKFKGETK